MYSRPVITNLYGLSDNRSLLLCTRTLGPEFWKSAAFVTLGLVWVACLIDCKTGRQGTPIYLHRLGLRAQVHPGRAGSSHPSEYSSSADKIIELFYLEFDFSWPTPPVANPYPQQSRAWVAGLVYIALWHMNSVGTASCEPNRWRKSFGRWLYNGSSI